MTVGDLLLKSAQQTPEKEALVYNDTRLTYAELATRVQRLAGGLRELGLQHGDRVGLLLYNSHHAYETLLATALSGLVFVPLNFMLNSRELAAIADHAGVRAIVTEPELYPSIAPILKDLPSLQHLIGLGDIENATADLATLTQEGQAQSFPVSETDLFGLMYTSGTTGLPKGVMLSHANIVAHAHHMVRDYKISHQSRGFIILPYFVGAALNGIGFPCISQGGTVVIQRRFTPEDFLHTIAAEHITHVQVVPTLIVRLLESAALQDSDTSSLQVFGYGSAPMPVDRLKEALHRIGPIFAQMYGLTETCAMAVCLQQEEHSLHSPQVERLASCGRPVQNVEVRIVDEQGDEVPIGTVGEVVIRGPTVMQGYWNLPEVTAESIKNGWFHSGDLAYRDAEDYIFLTDRKKDVIITGGFNVYPKEIEEVLYTHAAVFECAVIGVPDPEWGEAIKAVVAPRPGVEVSTAELLDFCRAHLTRFKCPKFVDFVEEIPRNPSGKVLKRLLRQQ
jgi:long-chain acyl-CoA synthetase